MNIKTFMLPLYCTFYAINAHSDNLTSCTINYSEDGFLAASYILTKKHMINNITKYCSELIEKDQAYTAKQKWMSINREYYDAAKFKEDHYNNYIKNKCNADIALRKKIESKKYYIKKAEPIVSKYFADTNDYDSKKERCNFFIEQIMTGELNISSDKSITQDLNNLMLFFTQNRITRRSSGI